MCRSQKERKKERKNLSLVIVFDFLPTALRELQIDIKTFVVDPIETGCGAVGVRRVAHTCDDTAPTVDAVCKRHSDGVSGGARGGGDGAPGSPHLDLNGDIAGGVTPTFSPHGGATDGDRSPPTHDDSAQVCKVAKECLHAHLSLCVFVFLRSPWGVAVGSLQSRVHGGQKPLMTPRPRSLQDLISCFALQVDATRGAHNGTTTDYVMTPRDVAQELAREGPSLTLTYNAVTQLEAEGGDVTLKRARRW